MSWVGVAEITERYGISRQTLCNWRKKPGFPKPISTQGNPVWELADIENWIWYNTPGRYSTTRPPNCS